VTGRDKHFIKSVTDEDNLEIDFLIIYNGTDIYGFNGNQASLIKRQTGKTNRLHEMLPLILRKSADWAEFITPDRNYYITYNDEPAKEKDNWVKGEALKGVSEFIQIYSLYENEESALEIARQLDNNFNEAASALVNGSWLNVAPAGVSKSYGVYEYAKMAGAAKEDILTIGDSYNDLDMIEEFNGFTVDNGAEAVKKIARAVYSGVWELIYNFKE
jgi:hydroxymethylpyrimidine pyrophosphatase-like HAD family hydrolase